MACRSRRLGELHDVEGICFTFTDSSFVAFVFKQKFAVSRTCCSVFDCNLQKLSFQFFVLLLVGRLEAACWNWTNVIERYAN